MKENGGRLEKEGRLVELVGDLNQTFEAPSRSKKGKSKGDVREGAMEKSRYVRIIEGKVRDDPIECLLSTGAGSTF